MDIEQLPSDAGVLICGHGSRAKIAEQEFSLLAAGLKNRFPALNIGYGFLEYSAPNIHMALDALREKGVTTIYAVPGMLFAATHAKNDIPSVLTTYQQKYPELTIEYGQELGLASAMIKAFEARIVEALGLSLPLNTGDCYDTMLVVVGRGTSVTEANAEVSKLTRIVTENLGFGWSETVYSGVTFPSVGRGLEMAIKLGFKKIVVAPYFLFGGRLIDRIYRYVDSIAEQHPDIIFYKADYLRDQSYVIDTFVRRINDTITGPAPTLSLMADFKQRLSRNEVDVHHHHAEFQPEHAGTDAGHSHAGDHHHHGGTAHHHDHHHAPYKHIAHPHGPRTMVNDQLCCCFMKQLPQAIIDEEQSRGKAPSFTTPVCKKPASV